MTGSAYSYTVDQVGGAALGDRAQRLLEDRGQPAGLVAGRGVVVHLAVVARGVVLPPADALDQLLADLAARPRGASAGARRRRSRASRTGSRCRRARTSRSTAAPSAGLALMPE